MKYAQKCLDQSKNFSSTTLGYSVVRIAHLDGAFSGILELEASAVEGQQLQQRVKKRRKKKGQKKLKSLKMCKILIPVHARAKMS